MTDIHPPTTTPAAIEAAQRLGRILNCPAGQPLNELIDLFVSYDARGELLTQWGDLAGKLMTTNGPLLPEPSWQQDVAYVAWVIDSLRGHGNVPRGTCDEVGIAPSGATIHLFLDKAAAHGLLSGLLGHLLNLPDGHLIKINRWAAGDIGVTSVAPTGQ